MTRAQVKAALEHTIASMESEDIASGKMEEFVANNKMGGQGSVLVALWSGGSAVILFDGQVHVDINLFTYRESKDTHDEFAELFMSQIPMLNIALRDEQPRGYGRVVNFRKDIEPRMLPHWAGGDIPSQEKLQ